ncbi:MAG: FitA-like ribbon-helix-helix domain-containing protein [Sphingomonadaceae bacterium]
MASLTVRDIPDDAKLRFRQVAAAHGRSMEEHLRQLVINAEFRGDPPAQGVSDVKQSFKHFEPEPRAVAPVFARTHDAEQSARIRAMSSGEFFRFLRDVADGVGLELPPRANLAKDRENFGAD